MKKLILALVALSACSMASAVEWDMGTLQKKVEDQEKRLAAVEKQLQGLASHVNWNQGCGDCPCPQGGNCICPPGVCVCPGGSNDKKTVQISWQGIPTSSGRSATIESAPDCINCIKLKKVLQDQSQHIEVTEYPSVGECPRDGLPYVALKENGKVSLYLHSSAVNEKKIRDWLKGSTVKTSIQFTPQSSTIRACSVPSSSTYARSVTRYAGPSWDVEGRPATRANLMAHLPEHGFTDFSGLTTAQLHTIHNNYHNAGRSGVMLQGQARQTPTVRYAPRQTYTPQRVYTAPTRAYQPRQYFAPSFCPSCVR